MPEECLTPPGEGPWIPLDQGIDFRRLFTSAETGRFTILLRCQPGSFLGAHKHLGAGEYFVVKGRMDYRMGSAGEGTYGYEPISVIHDHTAFPIYTELLFTNHGPVAFLDDQGAIVAIIDQAAVDAMAVAAG